MKAPTIKHEDYAVIADFIAVSFERDLDSFSSTYKTMNASYLENFKKAISQLKNNDSTNAIVIKQKETTANLYKQADELRRNITFLKDYATRSASMVEISQEWSRLFAMPSLTIAII